MAREGFEDLDQVRNDRLGVLGGEGSDFLEKVKTQVKPEGITSRISCGHCGHTNDILIGYDEAVVVSRGFLPSQWQLDQKEGGLFPNVGCAQCQYQMKLIFTQPEMKRWIGQALAQGEVQPQTIAKLDQDVTARTAPRR